MQVPKKLSNTNLNQSIHLPRKLQRKPTAEVTKLSTVLKPICRSTACTGIYAHRSPRELSSTNLGQCMYSPRIPITQADTSSNETLNDLDMEDERNQYSGPRELSNTNLDQSICSPRQLQPKPTPEVTKLSTVL